MSRIERLWEKTAAVCDAIVIRDPVNRFYFTRFSSSAGTLVLTAQESVLFVDARYIQRAREKITDCRVVLEDGLPGQLRKMFQVHKVETVGFEAHTLSFAGTMELEEMIQPARLIKNRQVSDAILDLRSIKDKEELACLREAQRITDYAFSRCLGLMRPGVSELDIMIAMGEEMARQGCEKRSFNMILTSGPQTALPHGDPAIRTLQKGEFVMMDVGAMVGGYSADMTRTVAIGAVGSEQKTVYNLVLAAQKAALAAMQPGRRCCDIDRTARDIIDRSPYKGTFGHGLGHSLGLEIHENPRLNQTCETALAPGMMMTVEPGIYLPGRFGVRIEDMTAVTETGCEIMTRSPKELMVVS